MIHVRALTERADRYFATGDYRGAERLYRQALAAGEHTFGRDSRETAVLVNSLGVVYKHLGQFRDAGRCYRRVLSILMERDDTGPADLAALYHNLGGLEHARRRFARGEPFARRSVALRRQAVGPRHPDFAADLVALAALLDQQRKFDEAERLYRRALTIFRRAYGPAHFEITVALNNLAALHQARGDDARALRTYSRALALQEQLLGPDRPDVAITCNNLATLYTATGKTALARPLYRRALAALERALGYVPPPHTPYTLKKEALVQVDGKFADAAFGRFGDTGEQTVAVLEGKGPRDPLDRPFAGRKWSGVDQALMYAVQLKIDWYLVTNLKETRLYHKANDTHTFERFETSKLATDDAELARFVYLLGAERVLAPTGNHLNAVLAESAKIGRELTNLFYAEYGAPLARRRLHRHHHAAGQGHFSVAV